MSTLLSWDFSEGDFDWQGDFADYPSGEDDFFQLDSGLRPLPNNLGDDTALFITGDNRSDDLFMYFRREINGLEPNTNYEVNLDIKLASNAPDGSIGIGGSPANSVFLKAGVTLIEPLPLVDTSGDLRLNVDKGNQANSGTDSVLLGDIAKPEGDTFDFDYEIIERTNQEPFVFSTDDSGSAWLYFGTDSGFEGTTALYYTNFEVDFTTEPEVPTFEPVFGSIDGDTIEVVGSNQIIFAGDMNDLVDASTGEGENRIHAGSGDDIVILGESDRAFGNDGDDSFFVLSGGENTITGGEGADQFWIASAEIPDAANIITDFTAGEDVIGIAGLGIGFEDLSITQVEGDALITANSSDLAILQGIDSSTLIESDFVFT